MGKKKLKRTSAKASVVDAKRPVRNPVAGNPLLGKSAAHGKTRKADRRASKISLGKMPFDRVTVSVSLSESVAGSSGILPIGGNGDALSLTA